MLVSGFIYFNKQQHLRVLVTLQTVSEYLQMLFLLVSLLYECAQELIVLNLTCVPTTFSSVIELNSFILCGLKSGTLNKTQNLNFKLNLVFNVLINQIAWDLSTARTE